MSSGQVANIRRCAADPSDLLLAIGELPTFTLACADRRTNSGSASNAPTVRDSFGYPHLKGARHFD